MKTVKIAHQKFKLMTRTSKTVNIIMAKMKKKCSNLMSYSIIHLRSSKAISLILASVKKYIAYSRMYMLSLAL